MTKFNLYGNCPYLPKHKFKKNKCIGCGLEKPQCADKINQIRKEKSARESKIERILEFRRKRSTLDIPIYSGDLTLTDAYGYQKLEAHPGQNTTSGWSSAHAHPRISHAIARVAEILGDVHKHTFHGYREAGLTVLEAGYDKGKWNSWARARALKVWGISQRTFSNIIQLGEMSDAEFSNVIANFQSLYAWASSQKRHSEQPLPELPTGKYRCIVVDPPWPMKKILRRQRLMQTEPLPYRTLSLKQIKSLQVEKLMADGCHVYLWVTQRFLPAGLSILKAWGVKYQCVLTWVKNVGFTPFSFMYDTEHVLFGRHGPLKLLTNGERLSFHAKVTRHSRKPDEFFEKVCRVSPEPRINLFAREHRPSFVSWGNEVSN